jgi:rhodanese-related sulfurtransferase
MNLTGRETEIDASRTTIIILGIVLAGGLLLPKFTPTRAKELLLAENRQAILVDIKSPDEFGAVHIDGSENWPLGQILTVKSVDEIPERFRNRTLLLISDDGMAGNTATKHLVRIDFEEAMNVRGGTQEWIGSVGGPEGDGFDRYQSSSGKTWTFPIRVSPLHEQLLTVISAFGVKPAYTILSLILVIILWRSQSTDLVALRWSMTCFFVGENFCAANYIVFTDKSYLFEYLHSFGMLLSFGFATYALLEGMDRRILGLSDPNKKCSAINICKRCIKYEDVPCGLKRIFFMIIPALAFVALMPICAEWHNTSYNTMIFGTFFHYARRLIYQRFEMQYCPIAAVVLLMVSLFILIFKKGNSLSMAKIFFAAGVGPMGFGMFRSILTSMYSQRLVWFAFWEEFTELLFIVGVCFLLWIFRDQLFQKPVI